VVRSWSEPAGQVFVDGARWRARREWAPSDEAGLREGDAVVVERVNGLTLSVRRAEEWELIT
jgi:membrane-bound serine protease (ClpP class)